MPRRGRIGGPTSRHRHKLYNNSLTDFVMQFMTFLFKVKKFGFILCGCCLLGWCYLVYVEKNSSNEVSGLNNRCETVHLEHPAIAINATWSPSPKLKQVPMMRRYRGLGGRHPAVPTWMVTNGSKSTTIRFFDTSPFSPSGKFLALLRFPDGAEGNTVEVKDVPGSDPLPPAQVVIVAIKTGQEKVVSTTRGWDTQTGAHVQWGASDRELIFNDVIKKGTLRQEWNGIRKVEGDDDESVGVGVSINPFSGVRRYLNCPVYMVSSDGQWGLSPCLERIKQTQKGYGIHVPGKPVPVNKRAEENDGLYLIQIETGDCRLLISFADIAAATDLDPKLPSYGFHAKFNRQMTRILFVVRTRSMPGAPKSKYYQNANHIITMRIDRDMKPFEVKRMLTWGYGHRAGSHPHFMPNGEEVTMNLQFPNKGDHWAVVTCAADKVPQNLQSSLNDDPHRSSHSGHISTGSYKGNVSPFESLSDICRVISPCGSGHPQGIGSAFPKNNSPDPSLIDLSQVVSTHAVTDAYPKECGVFKGLVKPGAVPLRLFPFKPALPSSSFSNTTKTRENLPSSPEMLRSTNIDMIEASKSTIASELSANKRYTVHPNTLHSREVELLQVMSISTEKFGGVNKVHMEWRCDMHPTFDKSFRWIAFNGRPGP